MSALEVIGLVASVAVASVLIVSSAAKLRTPSAFTAVLKELGLRPRRAWWFTVCAVELIVAVLLVMPVERVIVAAAVAFLGVVFAASGVRGLQIGRPIKCACFGAAHANQLGWAQVVALPVWLAAALAVAWWQPSTQTEQAAVAAAVLIIVLLVHLVLIARAMRSARGDRLAFAEGK